MRKHGTEAPRFVTRLDDKPRRGKPVDIARDHLSARKDLYKIEHPTRDLTVLEVVGGKESSAVRFGQRHRGVPVFGAQYLVHMRAHASGRAVEYVNGHFFTELEVDVAPRLTSAQARDIALRGSRLASSARTDDHGLTVLPEGRGVLAYHLTLLGSRFGRPVRDEVFVNAHTGVVASRFDNLHSAHGNQSGPGTTSHGGTVTLQAVHRADNLLELRDRSRKMFSDFGGVIRTHDVSNEDFDYTARGSNIETSPAFPFTDGAAVDAHHGAALVYDYYLNKLGRDSLDGNGMDILSAVHFGQAENNAFWDGRQVTYGDGSPGRLPMSADLDVVAHELTHGVTEFTANLAYFNQSGAMNEAYSDYFGNAVDVDESGTAMSDPEAGLLGEDLCLDAPAQCALRDLNDGRTVADYGFYMVDYDGGGVHLNSTIYGGALWDIRETVDKDNADLYVFRALERCLTPLATFVDGRDCTLAEADAAGATDAEIDAIETAFDGKGIVSGWETANVVTDSRVLRKDTFPLAFWFSAPQVSKGRYIIADYKDPGNVCCEPIRIYVGNVDGSGRPKAVGEHADGDTFSDETPDLSGRRAVWAHSDGGDFDIHTRILGRKVSTVVGTNGDQWWPSIDGRLVAWEDTRKGGTDIWARRIKAGKPFKVTGAAGEQWLPQVSGDWVAWWDGGDTFSPRIRLRNVETGKSVTIEGGNPGAIVGPPGVGPKHVYWYEDSNGDGDGAIMRARLGSVTRKTVVAEGENYSPFFGFQTWYPTPSANADWVTYHEEFGYLSDQGADQIGRDVWRVRATGGTPKLVTQNRGDQAYSAMAGGKRVVWLDTARTTTDLVTQQDL